MTEAEDNAESIAGGRKYSLLDNEALARYFTAISELTGEKRQMMVLAFENATNDGWRPKWAVKRALGK